MTRFFMIGKTCALAALLVGAAACGSESATIDAAPTADAPPPKTFTVSLTKAAEMPPCANAGASATGSATVTVAGDGSSIRVQMTYSGLSGTASAAHVHFGTPTTASGPVVLPFSSPATPIDQTFHSTDYVAATGAPATFADFVTMVRAGGHAYLNVHTGAALCPAGEIRGNIQ